MTQSRTAGAALVGASLAALAILAARCYRSSSHHGVRDGNHTRGDEAGGGLVPRKTARAWWQDDEDDTEHNRDTIPSIIEHFKDIRLDASSTVREANLRRTVAYYRKAREAHAQQTVPGHPPRDRPSIVTKRRREEERIVSYYTEGTKSHRTVVVMFDAATQRMLEEARQRILAPLDVSHDPEAVSGAWIPSANVIPPSDMHVTVATMWWWHTMLEPPERNRALSKDLVHRLKQAVVLEFHHPFQLELERILLLGGKTLVALWRTVGERVLDDEVEEGGGPARVQDRHGTGIDPLVRLRREIVRCFTTECERLRSKPLTYRAHRLSLSEDEDEVGEDEGEVGEDEVEVVVVGEDEGEEGDEDEDAPPSPRPGPVSGKERAPTIEAKTPGMESGDGFIHTTLCRFPPLDCFSMDAVDLEPVHRLCREATAACAGHRVLVKRFRFLETTGKGGESNPIEAPIFDEIVEAPRRVAVDANTGSVRVMDHSAPSAPAQVSDLVGSDRGSGDPMRGNAATIGSLPAARKTGAGAEELEGLFAPPGSPPKQPSILARARRGRRPSESPTRRGSSDPSES